MSICHCVSNSSLDHNFADFEIFFVRLNSKWQCSLCHKLEFVVNTDLISLQNVFIHCAVEYMSVSLNSWPPAAIFQLYLGFFVSIIFLSSLYLEENLWGISGGLLLV